MHEASITQALLAEVRTRLPHRAVLRSVLVEVGGLEHLDSELLALAWSGATMASDLAGSELQVRSVAVRVRCRGCGQETRPEDPAILVCAACGAVRPEVVAGRGVLLRSLEVEESS